MLKRCWCCGEKVNIYTFFEESTNVYFVTCGTCGAKGGVETTHEQAEKLWNRRFYGNLSGKLYGVVCETPGCTRELFTGKELLMLKQFVCPFCKGQLNVMEEV